MNSQLLSALTLLLWLSALTAISCLQFPDEGGRRAPSPASLESARVAVHAADHNAQEEARIFHQHGIRKKKKKKLKRRLLQCLLSSHFQSHFRQAPPPPTDAQGRFIFLNVYDIDINSNSHSNYDDNDDNSYNDNELCGGGGGGDHDSVDDSGFGQGINNLGSLVSNNPLTGALSPSDVVKPVFENPEKFIRKYVVKPLYRTFRPLYRLF